MDNFSRTICGMRYAGEGRYVEIYVQNGTKEINVATIIELLKQKQYEDYELVRYVNFSEILKNKNEDEYALKARNYLSFLNNINVAEDLDNLIVCVPRDIMIVDVADSQERHRLFFKVKDP